MIDNQIYLKHYAKTLSLLTTCTYDSGIYKTCPESKDTKVLNMFNIFNLQKRHYEWTACT
jgi:hypothetical protein